MSSSSKRLCFSEEDESKHINLPTTYIGQSVSSQILDIQLWLSRQLASINFSDPVSIVYNPIEYAGVLFCEYVQRFCNNKKPILLLGMNPGPWGMAQTGVPFGEVTIVRDWLQLTGTVSKPLNEHPLRPVTGLRCHRSEVSGRKFWGLIKSLSQSSADSALSQIFVNNFCPILFLRGSGCNVVPAQLKAEERRQLYGLCDAALRLTVTALDSRVVLGVGKFAESRATTALKHSAGHVKVRHTCTQYLIQALETCRAVRTGSLFASLHLVNLNYFRISHHKYIMKRRASEPPEVNISLNPMTHFLSELDNKFMEKAFIQAKLALAEGEVPVGCVFTENDQILYEGHNSTNKRLTGEAHAEMKCIDEILVKYPKVNWSNVTLYVTVEPCIMCATALKILRIKKIIFGCCNPRFGGMGTVLNAMAMACPCSESIVHSNVRGEYAVELLKVFYAGTNPSAPLEKVKKKEKKSK